MAVRTETLPNDLCKNARHWLIQTIGPPLSRHIGSSTLKLHMTTREIEEYRALRDTIRERGTARHWIVVVGLTMWCVLAVAVSVLTTTPVTTLFPLLLLVGVFEVVFALHTAVERVGRYVQVFFESSSDAAAWEHVAMSYGRSFGGGGIDALFSPIFATATLFNFIPVFLTGPPAIDWAVVGAVHVLFVVRVCVARTQAGQQRKIDLDRFEKLKSERDRNSTSS